MEITTILWREWLFLKRRFWRVTFSQMVSPLLYFVTFGMGLGGMVNVDGQPYLQYLIPGLLAMTTMRNSYTGCLSCCLAWYPGRVLYIMAGSWQRWS